MAFAGFIAVTVALDQKGRVSGEPTVFIEGIPRSRARAHRTRAAAEAARRYNPKKGNEEDLAEQVRRAVRRAANDVWGQEAGNPREDRVGVKKRAKKRIPSPPSGGEGQGEGVPDVRTPISKRQVLWAYKSTAHIEHRPPHPALSPKGGEGAHRAHHA